MGMEQQLLLLPARATFYPFVRLRLPRRAQQLLMPAASLLLPAASLLLPAASLLLPAASLLLPDASLLLPAAFCPLARPLRARAACAPDP